MPRFIVKQPDGRYAIFSTTLDKFVLLNATKDELIQFWIDEEIQHKKQWINETLDNIERGIPDRKHDWPECLRVIRLIHGEDALKTLESDLKDTDTDS